jgi:hypothetical protein
LSKKHPGQRPAANYYHHTNPSFRICGGCRKEDLAAYRDFKTKQERDRAERRDNNGRANGAAAETMMDVTIDLLSATDIPAITEMPVEIDRNDHRGQMDRFCSINTSTRPNFPTDALDDRTSGNVYAETNEYNNWQDANGNYHPLVKLGSTHTHGAVERLHGINRADTGKPGIIKYTHMTHIFGYEFIEKFAKFYFSDRIVPGRAKEWFKITRDECDALFHFLAKYPTAKIVEDNVLDTINDTIVSRILRG